MPDPLLNVEYWASLYRTYVEDNEEYENALGEPELVDRAGELWKWRSMKKGGKAVVEPENDPEQIIERMERLVEESSTDSGETKSLDEGVDPIAQKHRDAVRKGAE